MNTAINRLSLIWLQSICVIALMLCMMSIDAAPTLQTSPTTQITTAPAIKPPATTLVLPPEITGYSHTGCVNPGSSITILGKNFGTQKAAALGGHSIHVTLGIVSWSSTQIRATIPRDSRIQQDQWYYIGIKDPASNNWLSNINKNITICETTTTTTPSLNINPSLVTSPLPGKTLSPTVSLAPGSGTASPTPTPTPTPAPSPTPSATPTATTDSGDTYGGYYDYPTDGSYQWDDYGSYQEPATPTVLPNSYGSLIDRPLPPPPPNLANIQKQQQFIRQHAEPEEIIVISGDMRQARELAQRLGGYGLSAKRRQVLKNLGLVISTFRVPADVDLQQMTLDVRQANPDMWVDLNHRYQLLGTSRDTRKAKQLINWPQGDSQCGKGLRIGLIDTDIHLEHPALKQQSITSHSVLSQGIRKAQADHGTAIATLLVGDHGSQNLTGMLPRAQLFAVSIFRQRDEQHIDTTAEWIVSAIDWLLSQQVQVINMSLGGPRNLLVDVALQRSIQSGVAIIAAAGNSGNDAPVYPAAQPGVIAVTAIDHNMKRYNKASYGKYIDFAAPGVDIWTADGKGAGKFVSGTSFSTPFVTAAMATLSPRVGPRSAYEQLTQTAKDLGDKGKDEHYGWGLLQTAQCR